MDTVTTFDGWSAKAATSLCTEGADSLLCQQLVERWTFNDEALQPPLLESEAWGESGFRWSNLLEMLLENGRLSYDAYRNIIRAFATAFNKFDPNLGKGTLWFYDCMALRVQCDAGDPILWRDCATLLLDCCEKLIDVQPSSDRATYNELYSLFSLVADAFVVEIYEQEQDILEDRVLMGERVLRPETLTIFGLMAQFEYYGLNFDSQSDADIRDKRLEYEESRYSWLGAANERRKEIGTRIFETLNKLNPAIETWTEGKNRYDDIEKYGMQRMLDVPWFRLSLAMLRNKTKYTKAVRSYIPAIYRQSDENLLHPDISVKKLLDVESYLPKVCAFVAGSDSLHAEIEHGLLSVGPEAMEWPIAGRFRHQFAEAGISLAPDDVVQFNDEPAPEQANA
jgi:hypothetical protein